MKYTTEDGRPLDEVREELMKRAGLCSKCTSQPTGIKNIGAVDHDDKAPVAICSCGKEWYILRTEDI